MKIVRLSAENVKRLKAVEITPTCDIVTITGKNAQGKTSVLDAIWLALGGGAASRETTRPIRDGEDHAAVTLDLGDLVVTRTWTGDKTTLTVKSADGAKYPSPQGVLDALVGRLSFDPLEFTRLSAREQVAALLDLVDLGVDLDDLARKRAGLYDERTEIGRQGKALGAPEAPLPDVPEAEQSASDLITQIREAHAGNAGIDQMLRDAERAQSLREQAQEAFDRARQALADAEQAETDALHRVKGLPARIDVSVLEQRLDGIEDTNRQVRENAERRRRKAEHDRLRAAYDDLTTQIDALDKTKADALAAARFPVDGLGFDDSGVTYNGVPFSQASSAEQIRVSLAMAMALNPKLRVIRILDGSLLDADNLALIGQMAANQDFQVWVERVQDESETAVVIEDGAVLGAVEPGRPGGSRLPGAPAHGLRGVAQADTEGGERLMESGLLSPDCSVGKHVACSGDGWNDDLDLVVPCPCPCHLPTP